MLLTRRELLDIIETLPKPLQSTLISLAWHASRFQPNTINEDRYGLCQISLEQAQRVGFSGNVNDLLEPRVNITIAAELLERDGLVQFAGMHLAHELLSIVALAQWLDSHGAPQPAAIDDHSASGKPSTMTAEHVGARAPRETFPPHASLPRFVR